MKPGGKVLVVEIVVPAGNDPSFAKWMDLMMVAYGGKERSEEQYRELFRQAGWNSRASFPREPASASLKGLGNEFNNGQSGFPSSGTSCHLLPEGEGFARRPASTFAFLVLRWRPLFSE